MKQFNEIMDSLEVTPWLWVILNDFFKHFSLKAYMTFPEFKSDDVNQKFRIIFLNQF